MTPKITYVTDANGEILMRKKKRKNNSILGGFNKTKKIILIIFSIIAALALLIFILFKIGEWNMKVHYDEGKIIQHNGHTYQFNDNLITLSFIGYDTRDNNEANGQAGQADYLLLLAFDTQNSTLKGISVPRDTMVEPNDYSGAGYFGVSEKEQIAVTFSYGHEKNQSLEYTTEAMSRLIYNMPIKYYYGLDMEGIGPINDAIGGVTVKALETIPNTNIVEGQTIDLYGSNAQKYVQYRDENILESSELRRQRDIQYTTNFYNQALKNIVDIYIFQELFNQSLSYSYTNLGLPEFLYLAQISLTKNVTNLDIKSFKGQLKQGQSYVEFWPDENDLFETMLDVFYIQID